LEGAEHVNGAAVIVGELPEVPVAQIREAADWLRTEAGSAAVCLGVVAEGKPMLLVALTDDLVKKGLKAGDLIKQIVPAIDGRGGGKPNLAQAGGTNPEGLGKALEMADAAIRDKLGD
jgi:alanyl-tRNA synthetase